jgi:cobalt/nickel transport system ATP-binding protein
VRRRVGFLFQDSDDQLFCPTVAEDVAFGPLNLGKTRDEAWRIVEETLAALGLNGFEQRITYKLSGGEKRMVALASVLSMNPEVLLLDEPTAGLDDAAASACSKCWRVCLKTMLIATHDVSMTSLERVRRAIEFRGPDRVPIVFGTVTRPRATCCSIILRLACRATGQSTPGTGR